MTTTKLNARAGGLEVVAWPDGNAKAYMNGNQAERARLRLDNPAEFAVIQPACSRCFYIAAVRS